MEAIQNGEADYAVFPIENSSAGIVSENYDLMVEYNNYIVGEQIIRIDHALFRSAGSRHGRYHRHLFPPTGADAVLEIP